MTRGIIFLLSLLMDGKEVTLCDFATAGAYGNYYRTWLTVRNIKPVPFDPNKPVWTNRP